ncbi:MAG: lysozyme [Pleurocapsa sp.]
MLPIFYNSTIFLGSTLLLSSLIVNDASADNQSDLVSSNYINELIKLEILIASNITVLPTTVDLVKQFEGFSANAYIDTSGLPVVGYGQTRINGETVSMGQYITEAQADVALRQELEHLQRLIQSHVQVELNPHQLGALTSLVYNAGMRIVTHSTLIRKLNQGDYLGAAREFPRWNKANQGGKLVVFPGLTKRRLAEKQLFLTPYQEIASN